MTCIVCSFRLASFILHLAVGVTNFAGSCILMNCCQKWSDKPLIWGRSGTQYVAMVTKLLSSYCEAHLVEFYDKESNSSDTNWFRFFIIFDENLVDCMMSSLG